MQSSNHIRITPFENGTFRDVVRRYPFFFVDNQLCRFFFFFSRSFRGIFRFGILVFKASNFIPKNLILLLECKDAFKLLLELLQEKKNCWIFPVFFGDIFDDLIQYVFHAWHNAGSEPRTYTLFYFTNTFEKLHNFHPYY